MDNYQYGIVDRISPEAPVPVFIPTREESRNGMAANVAANLVALGCAVVVASGQPGSKTRLIDERSRQQIVRIDNDYINQPYPLAGIDLSVSDAVVVSDYNKGNVTYELIEDLRRTYQGPIFLDTKKTDLATFHNIFVKINEVEYSRRISINDQLIITLGSQGAMYKTGRDPKYETRFPAPKVEVFDVCGAGDTFLAAVAYKYVIDLDIKSAIEFAIRASACTVMHNGNYAPTLGEIS